MCSRERAGRACTKALGWERTLHVRGAKEAGVARHRVRLRLQGELGRRLVLQRAEGAW